jgi:hypothetical protein
LDKCKEEVCGVHNTWYAQELQKRIDELESDKSCALYVDYEKSCQALKKHMAEMSK